MSTKRELLVSPVGQIKFMALSRPVEKFNSPDAPKVYTIRLLFNEADKGVKEFKKTISQINKNLIGTKNTESGQFTVGASTRYEVEITNSEGESMEEAPNFYKTSTGTAQMVVEPYLGNPLGGSINLMGVKIITLDVGEAPASVREDVLKKLRDSLNK